MKRQLTENEEFEQNGMLSVSDEDAVSGESTDAENKENDAPHSYSVDAERETMTPSTELLEQELHRHKYKTRYIRILTSTLYVLVVVAAFSILLSTLFLPVLEIYGTSMAPCLAEGDVAVTMKYSNREPGDIIAFYYNNRILVKRIIATGGQTVYIDEKGNVSVDNVLLDEPYVEEKSFGNSDIEYPFTVPENTYFVLGDNRENSVDSRSDTIGCVGTEEIVGEIAMVIWPLSHFGFTD